MSWSIASCSFVTLVSGCTISPALAGDTKGTVVLSGAGSVPNPTGGSARTATVTAKIDVSLPPALVDTPSVWRGIYSGAPPSGGCDTNSRARGGDLGTTVRCRKPVHDRHLGGVRLQLPPSRFSVGLRCATSPRSVANNARISFARIKGGCSNSNSVYPTMISGCTINQPGGAIWDIDPTTAHASPVPTPDPLPTVDWLRRGQYRRTRRRPRRAPMGDPSAKRRSSSIRPRATRARAASAPLRTHTSPPAPPPSQSTALSISTATSASRRGRSSTRASAASSLPDRCPGRTMPTCA